MFTSRLPISTSVRRPANTSEHRPSNIPVTVQKANLFTPQTKRPFSGGTSTAGKSFTSGTATERKFQRSLKPAPDRDAQLRMFDNLTDFLRNNAPGFPCPEAKKFFSSVSTTESSRIFEFLISRLLPDFKVNRLEIDVPEALALLDYPYIRSVTKSSLVSVTTRQAAAGLLHIFDWLIRFIPTTDDNDMNKDDEPLVERQMVLMNSVLYPAETAYEENRKLLMRMHSLDDANQLDDELEICAEERNSLQRQLQEINKLEHDGATIWDDVQKCREYETQMSKYLQTKIDESNHIEQEHLDLKLRHEEDLRQIERLKHEINGHKLDVDQANRENENLSKLEQTLRIFKDQRVQADAGLKHVESKCQRLLERSHEWSSERSNQLKELADTSSSLPYLESINLDLTYSLETEEDIRNAISRLQTIASDLQPALSSKKLDEATELQQLEAIEAKFPAEVFPHLQEEIDRVEHRLSDANKNYAETLSANKSRIEDLNRQASQREQEALKRLDILKEENEREVQKLENSKLEFFNVLNCSKTSLQTHLDAHKQRVLIMTKDAKQQAEDWKEAELVWEREKTIVNRAYKLLKRHLDLP